MGVEMPGPTMFGKETNDRHVSIVSNRHILEQGGRIEKDRRRCCQC